MAGKRTGLGKGFGALVDPNRARPQAAAPEKGSLFMCPINRIKPNRYQPRQRFDDEAIQALAASINREGVLQPLAVRPLPGESEAYELIAGERRLRAAKKAGLNQVPCVLIETDEEGLGLLSLVENLMRENLNPLDEAEAYQQLIDNFDLKQEEIAQRVGRSRAHVANTIRLLGLTEMVRAYLAGGEITAGHGRAILALESADEQVAVAQEVLARKLSVRETEALVKKAVRVLANMKKAKPPKTKTHPYAHVVDDLRNRLGTKVAIRGGKARGKIEIHYFSQEELTKIIDLLLP